MDGDGVPHPAVISTVRSDSEQLVLDYLGLYGYLRHSELCRKAMV